MVGHIVTAVGQLEVQNHAVTYVYVHTLLQIPFLSMYVRMDNMYFPQPVTQGDITGYQVYYNGTMRNVNSSTTTLTFTAPSLPDGVFTGIVVVMVTTINRFGVGPTSDPATAEINGMNT